MKLRDYQADAVAQIYSDFKAHRKILLYMMMGSGKSEVAAYITRDALEDGVPVVMVVRGRELVENLSKRLLKYKIDHSVFMADHYRYDPRKLVQVCSIDTLNSRKRYPFVDRQCLVVLDECFTGDVEILTENGFVRFDKYNGEPVAQVCQSTKGLSFIDPIRVIKKEYNGKMIKLKSDKKIDLDVTENHEMFTANKASSFRKIRAKYLNSHGLMMSCAKISNSGERCSYRDLFQIMYQADGSHHYTNKHGENTYSFSFSKERKIERFKYICSALGYTVTQSNDNPRNIDNRKEKSRFLVKTSDIYSKLNRDYFGKLSRMTLEKLEDIVEEMVFWDGNIMDEDRAYYYSSSVKENTDFFQECAIMCQYHTNQIEQKDKRGHKTIYRLFVTKDKFTINNRNIERTEYEYDGLVYCVEVPNGLIVVRRNGKVLVTGNCHKSYDEIFENYKTQYILGLSATPFQNQWNFDTIIKPIENYELRDSGVLVPDKIFCPNIVDTSNVKIVAGDFQRDAIEDLMSQSQIVGNIVDDYIELGESRPAVCFAVSVEHSKLLAKRFNDSGISAMHCDAKSSPEEREKAHKGILDGSIKVICNVDIFSVGWDCPPISCVILARPTWSTIWYLQAVGRGLRSHPGKSDCIILDNAGNVFRHGGPYRIREISLEKPEKGKKKKREMDESITTCKECYLVFPSEEKCCPDCGWTRPPRQIKQIDGKLTEYQESPEQKQRALNVKVQVEYHKLEYIQRTKGLKPNFAFYKIKEKFGNDGLKALEKYLGRSLPAFLYK